MYATWIEWGKAIKRRQSEAGLAKAQSVYNALKAKQMEEADKAINTAKYWREYMLAKNVRSDGICYVPPDFDFSKVLILKEENKMNIEIGKWYETQGGLKAYVAAEADGQFYGHVKEMHTIETKLFFWNKNGTRYGDKGNIYNLVKEWKEPASGEAWFNFYPNYSSAMHETKIDADRNSGSARIARVKVKWKEGQFDD